MLKHCANNPGELKESPNCKNAMAAAIELSAGDIRKIKW